MNRNIEVANAMAGLKSIDPAYYEATLASRCVGETNVGSFFYACSKPASVEGYLSHLEWQDYTHPAISEGCRGFVAYSHECGGVGVVSLADLRPTTMVKVVNRKGQSEIQIQAPSLEETVVSMVVMICGMEGDSFVMFTVHPGNPIVPSKVVHPDADLSVAEARELGFTFAKFIGA